MTPFYAILYGNFLGALSGPDPQSEANKYAVLFLIIGVVAGTAQFLQSFAFTISGEALTMRIRELSFSAILRQELGWFDDPRRSVGGLCSRLSDDAASVNGVSVKCIELKL
jgi:ATP-binding cassette subfamily B (MDR/TAP) protein 1